MANYRRACPLCGSIPDARDATDKGYHLECAKEVSDYAMDELHTGNGRVFTEWYAKRYPGRPVPVRASPAASDQQGE